MGNRKVFTYTKNKINLKPYNTSIYKNKLYKLYKLKYFKRKNAIFRDTKTTIFSKQNRRFKVIYKPSFFKKLKNQKKLKFKNKIHFFSRKTSYFYKNSVNFFQKIFFKKMVFFKKKIPMYTKSKQMIENYKVWCKVNSLRFSNLKFNFKFKNFFLQKKLKHKTIFGLNLKLNLRQDLKYKTLNLFLKKSSFLRKNITKLRKSGTFFKKFLLNDFLWESSFLTKQQNYLLLYILLISKLNNVSYLFLFSNQKYKSVINSTQVWFKNTQIAKNINFLKIKNKPLFFKKNNSIFENNNPINNLTLYSLGKTKLNNTLNPWLIPSIRYGDSTFFKKPKTSLRQLKKHLQLYKSYTSTNVSTLLDNREKAVTSAGFNRINSDDVIFADTEFANISSRLYKVTTNTNQNLTNKLYFKYTYQFFYFLNKNLNYLNNSKPNKVIVFNKKYHFFQLSKKLVMFLWKIKTAKLNKLVISSEQVSKRRLVLKVSLKLQRRYKTQLLSKTKLLIIFFLKKLSFKWRVFCKLFKTNLYKSKKFYKNKLFSEKRTLKWTLLVKKNRKFFQRFEKKIFKNLLRKNTLQLYFQNRNNIEFRSLSRTNKLYTLTKKSSLLDSNSVSYLNNLPFIPKTKKLLNFKNFEFKYSKILFNLKLVTLFFKNPLILKIGMLNNTFTKNNLLLLNTKISIINSYFLKKYQLVDTQLTKCNLIPHQAFNFSFSRKIFSFLATKVMASRVSPWYYHNIIRFIEDVSGLKVLFQFYPFMSQEVSKDNIVRYKKWLPRMSYYERRLGHRFFLEEALHILHLGFTLKDAVLIGSWLKSMILRISFWKTKFIFRFLKYLFNNYFKFIFADLNVKGFKVKLKGKISVAGNSRKRSILYRVGSTSHSNINLRVTNYFQTITTFTGVMGLQVWIFY